MSEFASPSQPLTPAPPETEVTPLSRSEEARVNALTLRGVLIGLVFVVATCFIVTYAELVVGSIQIGYLQLDRKSVV